MFLSDEELERLTGYTAPARQARWLEERGWRFERSRGGRVVVSRAHVEAMLGAGTRAPEPDFGALLREA